MISIDHLTLAYGDRRVIEGFSAEIARSTITAITGRNGVGKSTLLAALAGDLVPVAGSIRIDNRLLSDFSLRELSEVRALAQQSHPYWMAFTTHEILELGFTDIALERKLMLIEELGLSDYLEQPITTLSGGQLQRVEIARSFMKEVPLVLLDEPFASQDLPSITRLKKLINGERDQGRTIVIVTHSREDDLTSCDQVINLDATKPAR